MSSLPLPTEERVGWPWTKPSVPVSRTLPCNLPWPRISVITPSYNQGQFLEETLRSVLLQDYPNLEYLVLDGGSTDNSFEILERYSAYLSYWHSKPDRGQADAINQGMRLSSGEVLCWLNSDDLYLPDTLFRVAEALQGRTHNPHLIYGSALGLSGFSCRESFWESSLADSLSMQKFADLEIAHFDYIVQPSAFWTRALWQATGELNPTYHYVLDWDWFIRAAQFTQFEPISEYLSVYRTHDNHKTRTGGDKRRQEIQEVACQYASKDWADLYIEVKRCYPRISKYVNSWKIPGREKLLPLFFPRLASKLKDVRNLYTVLTMYG